MQPEKAICSLPSLAVRTLNGNDGRLRAGDAGGIYGNRPLPTGQRRQDDNATKKWQERLLCAEVGSCFTSGDLTSPFAQQGTLGDWSLCQTGGATAGWQNIRLPVK